MFVNIAYFAAGEFTTALSHRASISADIVPNSVPKDVIKGSSTIAASLFFEAVFGSGSAGRGLNFLILMSSFGNLISNMIGASRIIRECGR